MKYAGFGAYWAESARQIPDKGDLSAYWVGISSVGEFFGTAPSYTSIRDPMLRFCHRLIACSIAGRSQAPKKVTITDLFYLKGMDVGSVNIPYLLARLQGLTVIVRDLPVIDMAELAILAPVQAPHPPKAVGPAKSLPHRVARLEEEVNGMREALGEQRE
ncbi:hypothetical protein Tco_0130175, partial [Tanacetum coccineum]